MSTFYDRALEADRANDLCAARDLLHRAVDAGEERARLSLAGVLLDGRGGPVDPEGAVNALLPLEAGDPLARRMLATALALGAGGLTAGACRRLNHARDGDREAAVELGVLLLQDNPGAAFSLLTDAAKRGSGLAVAGLVEMARLHGNVWPDLERQLADLSASGYPLAGPLKSRIPGTARSDLPPRFEGGIDDPDFQFLDIRNGALPVEHALSEAPRIAARSGVFSPALCDYLLAVCWPALKRAEIFNTATGRTNEDPHRKAYSTSVARSLQSLPVAFMTAQMAAATGATPLHGEGLAVLVYYPGDEYRPHLDCFAADDGWASAELAAQGQRRATALTALNDRYDGGETAFPRAGVRWRGKTGDVLTFENVTGNGSPDPMSLHAGTTVDTGWKALASLWVREGAPGPAGIAERAR